MALDTVLSIASKVADFLVVPIGRQIGYLINYNDNIVDLKNQVNYMTMIKERIQHDVDLARKQGEEIESDVQNWLSRADAITEETKELLEDEDKSKEKCFMGLLPNFKARHQLSRKVKKKSQLVVEFHGKGKFQRVSYRAPSQGMGVAPLKDYEAFESRKPVLNEILEALGDVDVNLIGVYGMPGVGKTTFVKYLVGQVEEKKMFEMVVLATVTQSPDLKRIQGEIADGLGFKFDAESEKGRANRLRERLKKEKKVLIILDDLWSRIDLEEVGIPLGGDLGGRKIYRDVLPSEMGTQQNSVCKVLITSRNRNLLSREMGVRENYLLTGLPQNEAWDLFEKMIGGVVKDSDFQDVAAEIAKKCSGLPILLVTVARALRGGDLSDWKDALEKLKRFDNEDIDAQAFSTLELSYNSLRGAEIQRLFLLCGQVASFSYKFTILDLLKYAVGMGLFKHCNTVEMARHRLYKLVNDLKASCLLMEGDSDGRVKMHDVIRRFAVSIASRDHHMLTVADEQKEWPVKHILEQGTTLCMPNGNFPPIPAVFECPQAEVFVLYNKDRSLRVPDDIFGGMKKLKVMDMTEVHLSQLPPSLRFLENLQTLCLDRCVLGDIAMIGELRMLQVLSLMASNIDRLPKEIRQLTRLQLLDLSHNPTLQVIPPNVLSCLTLLEDLYMENSFKQWADDGPNKLGNNASMDELKHLQKLVTLDIEIISAKLLPKDLFFEKLERFRILIGDEWDWSDTYKCSRTLKLRVDTMASLEAGIQKLLRRTEDLHLHDLKTVRSILSELDAEGFHQLKQLHIQNCPDVRDIVDSMMVPSVAFPRLEFLSVYNLNMLQKICRDQPMAESFSNLRILKVAHCHALKNLFSFSMARGLSRLEEISIIDCKILDGIFIVENEGDAKEDEGLNLNQLCRLTLEFLPQFRSTWSSHARQKTLMADPRMSNEIVSEEEVLELFNKKILLNLKDLRLSSIKVEKMWYNPSAYWLQKLTSLTVEDCGKLKYIFNPSMVKSLAQLEKLVVCDCKLMEEVIAIDDGQIKSQLVFPKLYHVKLKDLPKLKRFCRCQIIKCPFLKELHIECCPEMKTLVSGCSSVDVTELNPTLFDEKVFVPNLEDLQIIGMDHLGLIWANGLFQSDSFCKLKTLIIYNGKTLLKIFPSDDDLRKFKNLVTLEVRDCDLLEEVFDLQFLRNGNGTHAATATQLISLDLQNLPNLKNVWSGNSRGILSFQNLSMVSVWNCPDLKSIFPASIALGLQQLVRLNIVACGIEVIVSKEEELRVTPMFVFQKMIDLELFELPELRSFYPGMHTLEWPVLKELNVHHCDKMVMYDLEFPSSQGLTSGQNQIETQVDQPFFSFTKIIPNLEQLAVNSKEITMIKQHQFPQNLFDKLKVLYLQCFHDESIEFPFDVLQRFHNMETLGIADGLFGQLFSCGLVGNEELAKTLARLQHLTLSYLPNLEHIWDQAFPTDQLLPNLGTLEVWNCDKLISLAPSTASFQNLKSLEVYNCPGLRCLISSSIARSFVQLTEMSIESCSGMTEIFANERDEAGNEIIFPKLQSLELSCLTSLVSFCSADLAFKFPSLSEVIVTQCPAMKTFTHDKEALRTPKLQVVWLTEEKDKGRWTGDLNNTIQQLHADKILFHDLEELKLSPINVEKIWPILLIDPTYGFLKLTKLTVEDCGNLKYLFNSFMVKSLVQLEELEISNCMLMEEIVLTEQLCEGDITSQLVFPKLHLLRLQNLPKLKGFCSCLLFKSPWLKKLYIICCPEMKTFVCNCLSMHMAVGSEAAETNPTLFDEKVFVPNLEELQIIGMDHLVLIWTNGLFFSDSFCKLKILTVYDGKNLLKIFPSNDDLRRFKNLVKLKVRDCDLLEEVFDLQFLRNKKGTHAATATQLINLDLLNLPNLKNVWNGNPRGILSFQNLGKVLVRNCSGLKSIFPVSVALGLQGLVWLNIDTCGVEVIVSKEEELGATPIFVFPKMISLRLWELPELESFYPEMHNSEWPLLNSLWTYHCDKLTIFDSELQNSHGLPLFSFTKIVPNLEELSLTSKEVAMINQGQFPLYVFDKLKVLAVQCFHDESANFPFDTLERIHKVEKLTVGCCYLKQLFPCGLVGDEEHTKALARIQYLQLEYLPNLECIWDQSFPVDQLLPNLGALKVWKCRSLINLAPPTASFQTLRFLDVWNCPQLIYLIEHSTAESFVQLIEMSIRECGLITEIVAKEGDDIENDIVFMKLRRLVLDGLTSLSSFSSANLAFKFPTLSEVIVTRCPKMVTFSLDSLSTPNLERVWLTKEKDRWQWKGDLNNTIQELYKETNALDSGDQE